MSISRRAFLTGLAVTPAALALGTALDPAPAAATTYPPAGDFTLHYRNTTPIGTTATYSAVIDDLHVGGALPWAGVDEVLNSANRTGASHPLGVSAFAQGWIWQDGDDTDPNWYPQGITTSADYHDDGVYNGRKVILVSWYDHNDPTNGKGVRISFVDMTDPSAPTYRHVLLVEPYYESTGGAGVPDFRAVNVHAGGIMWYGDLLYVVETGKGIRVFDTSKMMKVSSTGDTTTIGRQSDGSYTAHNYLYVLPQTLAYDAAVSGGQPAIQWSFISLDRTTSPDSIVVGEYASPGDGKRLFRWDLDYTTRLLTASGGVATATFAAVVDINEMQGATSVDGKYFISRSNGNLNGNILTWVPGNTVNYNDNLPHTEDLSYDKTTGWLWNLAEEPAERYVFARTAADLQ